ncbi:YigZ family protein [Brevibacterium aurantiacum]|uniref:YigZ family protein n=1 Tax=Brevibacterium aurantiacum TaxID=273384 RepID=A0A2A3ZH80_BREAU|nr:YigZ family protein [Brevibacterium aurantiacum]MDN5550071.1 YigZ family protein [Brevibacterium sp.]AZL14687.1 YigZ family protein [Brevibacterium aurantiacum]MDN5736986.1 YigZ family protein [Brevibacterium aurantiacum]MDN5775146.1 YigZ family protein [Brevibacterium aurantiacum]PCC50867.1 YigZ family protein [Brevibacterium aurantiacum]
MPYRTIAAPVETEIEIKKSRFIGFLAPVADEAEAREVIAERRSAHPKARHHCTAFVLDPDSRTQRFSDDGEPAGTAGAPILDVVSGHGLTFVVAVVTRYFGGTLLGAGGLVRAYGQATSAALETARIVTKHELVPVRAEVDYAQANALDRAAGNRGWTTRSQYGAAVHLDMMVPVAEVDAALAIYADVTAGQAEPAVGDVEWV